jgi:hypothetical protein
VVLAPGEGGWVLWWPEAESQPDVEEVELVIATTATSAVEVTWWSCGACEPGEEV